MECLLLCSVNLLSSSLLSKNIKIKIFKSIILPVVLRGCEILPVVLCGCEILLVVLHGYEILPVVVRGYEILPVVLHGCEIFFSYQEKNRG